MKSTKKVISTILIYVIIAVILTISTLAIPFPKPAASWIVFAFSLGSLIAGCCITLFAFGRSNTLKSKFYGFPVFRIGAFYTIVQLVITLLIYIVGAFINLPYWIGLSISILLLGVASIGVIAVDNARDYVNDIDIKNEVATKTLTRFNVDIADILDGCKDPEVYEALKKLNDKFKYSDQISSSNTEEKESSIMVEINNLRLIIGCDEKQKIIEQIQLISNLLSSRNRICEVTKRQ